MIEYYSLKTLFMGDASTQIEKRLIDVYGDQLDCDILKVGHHGSKTSTSQELLSYTSPQLAVLSCSDSSTFFPNSQVVENLNQYNCKILSSAKQGNFVISYANNEIVFGKRDAQFNYWTIIFSVVLMALFILWKVPFTDKNSILNNIKR